MQPSGIREIVIEQRREIEEILSSERIIEREIKDISKEYLKYPNVLAILGVRRCGKSTFSWQIFSGKKFAYINFDDERLIDLKKEDLNKVLQVFYEIYGSDLENIILDEPHNIFGWELFVNRLRRTKKVIITGSNSKLLSGELVTRLTGRYIDFTLFPFSFREFLSFEKFEIKEITTLERGRIMNFLREYLENGGFPEFLKYRKSSILQRIYSDIITKDVIKRLKIKKETELKKIASFLVSNFSKEITYSSLKNLTQVKNLITISKWVNALKDAYLFFILERFSPKLKQQILAPKKVYCIDNGIINAIAFKISENFGRLMENLVAIELFRRKSYWFNNWEIYYFKDYQQREVDFVIKEGIRVKQLIQVTYASSKDEIEQREIKALEKAYELFKKDKPELLMITWDYEDILEKDNLEIKCIPLWKWLLNA